ncbi:MAG: hypothetical protein ACP5NE_02060 [Candidatus Micrarchaeia archaeon]
MSKKRCFSLYDIEEYLKEVGAEKVSEKAVVGFEAELEETVKELLGEAEFYANYAGRKKLITNSDLALAASSIVGNASIADIHHKKAFAKKIVAKRSTPHSSKMHSSL